MEEGGEAASPVAGSEEGEVLEHQPHANGRDHTDNEIAAAYEGFIDGPEFADPMHMAIPRSMANNSTSPFDEEVDALAELAGGFHISPARSPATFNSEQVYQEDKDEAPIEAGDAPLSPDSYEPQEQDELLRSPHHTDVQNTYDFHAPQEQNESLQSPTPTPNAYHHHQSPISHQNNQPWSSWVPSGGALAQDTSEDPVYKAFAGPVFFPSQGSHSQNHRHSSHQDLAQGDSSWAQGQAQLQVYHSSISGGSYGSIEYNGAYGGYGALGAPDGGNAQYPNRPRRNRRRSRPASDFTQNASLSTPTPNGYGQTGTAYNQWQPRNSPDAAPSGQQHGLGSGSSASYVFHDNNLQAGIDSRIDDLVEGQHSGRTMQPGTMANAYASPASPTAPLPNSWLSYPSGSYEQRPGFGHQAGRAPRHGFAVHQSRDFSEGRVFKIDWPEPRGSGAGSTIVSGIESNVFHKKRRFIIASTGPGHSYCLPIFTYGHRGCRKWGVKPAQHGIVYSPGIIPALLDGEPTLGYEPIMMIPTNSEGLTVQSRINYAKPHTVEHNVLVQFVGYIDESHTTSILQNMFHAMQNHKNST